MFKALRNTKASDIPSLSGKEMLILELLINSGREMYGLEMVDTSDGELKRGTIYVTLQRMKEKGLIDSKQEPRTSPEVGIPRRMYWATGEGQRVFAAYQAACEVLVSNFVAIGG